MCLIRTLSGWLIAGLSMWVMGLGALSGCETSDGPQPVRSGSASAKTLLATSASSPAGAAAASTAADTPSATKPAANAPAADTQAAATKLTAAEREDALRLAATAVLYQGILEQALSAHDKTLKECGDKIGESSSRVTRVERCAPMFARTLKRLRAELPTMRDEDSCSAQHREHAQRLLSHVIAKAEWAPRDPIDGMGHNVLLKRSYESPPKTCPAMRHFRCDNSKGIRPCEWSDLATLWTDTPLGDEHTRAITLVDGTPITRKGVQQKLEQYLEQSPAP